MAETIGTAYIQIEPSTKGIAGRLNSEMQSAGESGGKSFGSGFASVVGTVGKATAAAAAVGTAAVAGMVKTAVSGFGEYEQLVGGVETLYGNSYNSLEEYANGVGLSLEEASNSWEEYQARQDTVLKNASNAYQTAGLSTNEYMETVNSFAAALNESLGEYAWQSANYADMAVTDMADNANKMGTSMESIQNAYQGFAKGNFTMLDNLKLGYGGTKGEMERLMRKAEELEGYMEGSLDVNNFADIVDAIHIVQENLGITGTTAEEASTTIQGSLASLQAAWSNALTGMATEGADLTALIEQLVDAAKTFLGNLTPVISTALEGVSKMISELAPVIAAELPALIESILPGLLSSGVQIVQTLGEGILKAIPTLMPSIMKTIEEIGNMLLQMLPQLINVGMEIILQLANGITKAVPELVPAITDVIIEMVKILTNPETLTAIIQAGVALIAALADGLMQALPKLAESAPEIIQNLVDAISQGLPIIIDASIQLINAIVENMPTIIQALIDAMPQIVQSMAQGLVDAAPLLITAGPLMIAQFVVGIVNQLPQIINLGKDLVMAIIKGLSSAYETFAAEGPKILGRLYNRMSPEVKKFLQQGKDIVKQIIDGIGQFAGNLYSKAVEIINNFKAKIDEKIKSFTDIGKNIVDGIKKGLEEAWDTVVNWFKEKLEGLKKAAKDALKIGSPSKVFADEVGRWIPAGIAKGIEDGLDALDGAALGMTARIVGDSGAILSAGVTASRYASEADTSSAENDTLYKLLSTYLPIIANGEKVTISLDGDAGRLFRLMQIEGARNAELVGV